MYRFVVAARAVAAMAIAASIVTSTFAACNRAGGTVPPASVESSATSVASAPPSERATLPPSPAVVFPTAAFADIGFDAVTEETAATFQAALDGMAGGGGMAATVITPEGTWSGAAG